MNTMRQKRRERLYSQSKLAELSGLPQTTISQVETGIRKPHRQTKMRIENILGSVDWKETYNQNKKMNYEQHLESAKRLKLEDAKLDALLRETPGYCTNCD